MDALPPGFIPLTFLEGIHMVPGVLSIRELRMTRVLDRGNHREVLLDGYGPEGAGTILVVESIADVVALYEGAVLAYANFCRSINGIDAIPPQDPAKVVAWPQHEGSEGEDE